MKNITCLLMLVTSMTFAQNPPLSMFDNLTGKSWKAEGNWGNGTAFYQEVELTYSLDSTLIITNSIGFIDKEQKVTGHRNHGVRIFDQATDTIKFWEFDIFGGITEGVVYQVDKNIVYQYPYGGMFLTEMWEYVDDSTYNFKVGVYTKGTWQILMLKTQFKEVSSKQKE